MMKRSNASRALAIAAGLVIVALTGAAFWLSYAHLAEVALGHGLEQAPVRAWAWPACLDLFIMAGELMWLRAAIIRRVDWWAIALTAAGSLGSIALNVAGVGSSAQLLDYVVAAVPPTAALLAFGALMRQIHQALAGHTEVTAERAEQPTADELRVVSDFAKNAARVEEEWRVDPREVVTPPVIELPERSPMWHDWSTSKVTAAVPAEAPREVVTEVVTRTPADLRRDAKRLHRQVVRSGGRGVTIDQLRDTFGLSRREATDLRREVVAEVAS